MANSSYALRCIFHTLSLVCLFTVPYQTLAMAPAALQGQAHNVQPDKVEHVFDQNGLPAKAGFQFEKRFYQLFDYLIPIISTTAVNSLTAYQQEGPDSVMPEVVKPTIISVIKDGVKYGGKKGVIKLLKSGLSVTPHGGQKKVVDWGISGLMSGIHYRVYEDKSPSWLSRFLIKQWLPSFVQSQVVNFMYKTAVTASGVDYPVFVQNRDWLHHLAKSLFPFYTKLALSLVYNIGFNYLKK